MMTTIAARAASQRLLAGRHGASFTRLLGVVALARLLGVVALAMLSGAALAQAYYPAEAGMSWTYSSGETQLLSGPRDLGGRQVMVLTHYYDGVPISEDYMEYTPQGVISYGSAAGGEVFTYQPALIVYPQEPLASGMTWKSTTSLSGFNLTLSSEVVGLRGVATPVGRFNALLIRQTTLTSNGGQTILDIYFVPTVGIVRFETQDGTVIDLIEKSF
ncbi:MAG TPA: hypothetical protein VFD39_11415 [Trueperaceae bacterium]|nr:hypothetical protein [Trueperaceae bacterium]